ncbi:thioredoxin [Bailinhaonella thermotolerans]|uniref:Thioredoxin n=1 Tax=Bailinhaonella thermotolerans TaxID=1070861 RepID=A0A3A4B2U3_9ACTN|nr:thioredoxin [Bailinhaonella thermotolerans]RJL32379.1 thioredoxin [Bailinhaonella thermotolerans]
MSTAIATTDTFDELINGDLPVLVEFGAVWCGPCRMIEPVLEEMSVEYADRLRVAKIDVDEHPEIAMRYGALSVPTLILFKDGEQIRRTVGARPKRQLLKALEGGF